MRVLSLFDGISTARLALEKLVARGILPPITEYLACELDHRCRLLVKERFSDTKYLCNDVRLLVPPEGKIDLLIGNPPRLDFEELYGHYIRILEACRPKYFLFSRTTTIEPEIKEDISYKLHTCPVLIDAARVSAQMRPRYYWTNITQRNGLPLPQPDDKYIYLQSIMDRPGVPITLRTGNPITKSMPVFIRGGGQSGAQNIDFYMSGVKTRLLLVELERLVGVPDNYTLGLSKHCRWSMLGGAFSVPVIEYILEHMYDYTIATK